MRIIIAMFLCALCAAPGAAQTPYLVPPAEVVKVLDAPPTPYVLINPPGDALLLVDYKPHPSIGLLAEPFLKLAGERVNPRLNARQRTTEITGYTLRRLTDGATIPVRLPAGTGFGLPVWSNDGRRFAFARDVKDGVELWVGDIWTGKVRLIKGVRLNDVLADPITWMGDNTTLMVFAVPAKRGRAPVVSRIPAGPTVEETAGKVSRMPTFQDLLRTPQDEELFAYYGTSQLVMVNSATGAIAPRGRPGLYTGVSESPDRRYLLVSQVRRPFSYRVPYDYFSRTTEVWTAAGEKAATVADLPVSDDIPSQGVPRGPRAIQWRQLYPASLVWVEAQDGGDPMKDVPLRDFMVGWDAPFADTPGVILKIKHRFRSIDWTQDRDMVLVTEYDRARRWRTTSYFDFKDPGGTRRVVFDMSVNDAYKDPGRPLYETRADGTRLMRQWKDWGYFVSRGATPEGDRPGLDRYNLYTGKREEVFRSREGRYEQVLAYGRIGTPTGPKEVLILRSESSTVPPNIVLHDPEGEDIPLTSFTDPAPELTGMKKELLTYRRADGTPLSGTLYLPPGHVPGTRLPCVIWAYPLEYSDAGTAGQVRAAPTRFTYLRGSSPLFFVMQGYAVLMDATMPVVGDPETMNNTFVEQIVSAGRAAIDKLDTMGVIDRSRVLVMGHSYGAFMTANLLAHSDDFAAGIARSGAYNRTLTPFGFQSERRSFWEATDTYMRMSPFTHAHRINEPLLLIHGEADNNPGTFTVQSERMFDAIRGNGGTARLVLLPHESHGYTARESVLHALAEMFAWADRYVKNRGGK